MLQLGIRLHDVNTGLGEDLQTMEARAQKAHEEGFTCVHLAYSKVMKGYTFDEKSLTEGLAGYTKRVFEPKGLDIAVLGCYYNLAHPDSKSLEAIQRYYYGHIRAAAKMNAGVVGTETGAPNAEYRMDAYTHGEQALNSFMHGLEPVIKCAEDYGVTVAIEPVWKHIVYNADRARQVIKSMQSHNLRIIFDPVNLLYPGNTDKREDVFQHTIETLGDEIDVVHLKDYVPEGDDLRSIAAGTGEMDYTTILRFLKKYKPCIHATLENTCNENAERSKNYILEQYAAL